MARKAAAAAAEAGDAIGVDVRGWPGITLPP